MEKFMLMLVRKALESASPQIIASIRAMVQEMVERAEKTENPWDDIVCGLLQMVVGKPGSRVEGDSQE
ncbi:MAG: hypothetical protein KAT00_02210 [Planctomycetes bacterium]|nr:hypothetical protein [Planctomycetota bacterium]